MITNPMEDNKMTNVKFSLVAATFVGLSAFSMSSLSANASMMEDLGKCRFFTKEKVVACCNRIIRLEKKRPYWMIETESSCQTAATCVPKKYGRTYLGKPRCYVEVKHKDGGGANNPGNPSSKSPPPPSITFVGKN
jgi:hypothetical protein